MTVYSRWKPEGGYDYFEAEGGFALGDDLPQPKLAPASEIGVPSVEAGRALPFGAKYVGSGDRPLGLIAPMDSSRLRELGAAFGGIGSFATVTAFALGALSMWLYFKWKKRHA